VTLYCILQVCEQSGEQKSEEEKEKNIQKILPFTKKMRDDLLKGEWLGDEHIHLSQSLLKAQFPHVNGLQSTLLSENDSFRTEQPDDLQIHFVAGNHCVTSSSFGREVTVYDSKFNGKLHPSLTHQLARIHKCLAITMDEDNESTDPELVVKVTKVQQQLAISDCGVFAIAFALHVALGDNLQIIFDQSQMRHHLLGCFQKKKLQPFPHQKVTSLPQQTA